MEEKRLNVKKIIITLCIIIVCLVVLIFVLDKTTNLFAWAKYNKLGNSMGNLRNYGYAATEGKYIYYITPNDDSNKVRINKAKLDGTNSIIIYESEEDLVSLNVYKNKLYFIGLETNKEAQEYNLTLSNDETPVDDVDNKIYQMNTDGTGLVTINDNEFGNEDYQIAVTSDRVFYIGTNYNVCSMNLDGTDKKELNSSGTGFLGMNDKYILYNDFSDSQRAQLDNGEQIDNPDFITYIMDIDGNNAHVVDGSRFYSVNIVGKTIYYTDADKNICSVNIDGTNKKVLISTSGYNLNATNNKLFYLNYKDEINNNYDVCVYRCNLDGTKNEAIVTLKTHSQFLDVLNNNPLYMDARDNSGKIYLYNVKKNEEVQLYSIGYDTIDVNTSDEETEDEYDHIEEISENDELDELNDSHAL